jgi:hypothetical protein
VVASVLEDSAASVFKLEGVWSLKMEAVGKYECVICHSAVTIELFRKQTVSRSMVCNSLPLCEESIWFHVTGWPQIGYEVWNFKFLQLCWSTVRLCWLVNGYRHFGGTALLQNVSNYQLTQCNITEDFIESSSNEASYRDCTSAIDGAAEVIWQISK